MSKSFRLVFLAAIIGLAGMKYAESSGSPSRVEGADHNAVMGRTAGASPAEGVHQLFEKVHATTNNTISVKLSNIPVGKVIQVGDATNGLKFVKISDNQYISVAPQCPDPVLATTGAQKLLTYTGNYQEYTFYAGCEYQIELWGASGGSCSNIPNVGSGRGSYVSGYLNVANTVNVYFYLGGDGYTNKGWNGGGAALSDYPTHYGGGATDMRTKNGNWNDSVSLRSRLMVASGGAGGAGHSKGTCSGNYTSTYNIGGNGGGISGYDGRYNIYCCSSRNSPLSSPAKGGTQISGGIGMICSGTCTHTTSNSAAFGIGATDNNLHNGSYTSGGGGGGWYGGGSGATTNCHITSSAGGSSYISGHTGCVAVTSTSSSSPKSGCATGTTDNSCSISPYGYTFTNTVMIDGAGYQWTNVKGALKQMPNPTGGNYASGVGHSGNGYARITRLN